MSGELNSYKHDWQMLKLEFFKYNSDNVAEFLRSKGIDRNEIIYKNRETKKSTTRTATWIEEKKNYKNRLVQDIVANEIVLMSQDVQYKETVKNLAVTKYNVLNGIMEMLNNTTFNIKDMVNLEKAMNILNKELGQDEFSKQKEKIDEQTAKLNWVLETDNVEDLAVVDNDGEVLEEGTEDYFELIPKEEL
jgi:hypothetical protein